MTHSLENAQGTIAITGPALASVVIHAAERADGARVRRPKRGLEVSVAEGRVRVELELAARYGTVLPELARAVQASIAEALATMAGLEVDAVDVAIEELDA